MNAADQYNKVREELLTLLNIVQVNESGDKQEHYEKRAVIDCVLMIETILKNYFDYHNSGSNNTLKKICDMIEKAKIR